MNGEELTAEDIAAHVEKGGRYEWRLGAHSGWMPGKWNAEDLRTYDLFPDRDYRLVPLPTTTPSAPCMVPSLVEAPEGAVLARWEDVRVGDRYRSPYGGKYAKEAEGGYEDRHRPLVWCWPAPPVPVTVPVDVDLLERLVNDAGRRPSQVTSDERTDVRNRIHEARS